jgi:hypothetical protein
VNALGAHNDSPSDFTNNHVPWMPRELQASREADRQGLRLRRSSNRPSYQGDCRYDLIYERYNQPVAVDLELTAIEVWLNIPQANGD